MEWARVEPVLKACYAALGERPYGVAGSDAISRIDPPMAQEEAGQAMLLLDNAGYIQARFGMGTAVPHFVAATEKGLQKTSGWPSESGVSYDQRLVEIIDQRLTSGELGDVDKSKLIRLREAVLGAGQTIVTDVLARLVEHHAGI